jgi:hypothetical protein
MPRPDLLALTEDDLAVLANRGSVKRARKEVDEKSCTAELTETDGEVLARWSDGVECRLPAGKTVREGRCSCEALGTCRHLVRTVLAYQAQATGVRGEPAGAPSPVADAPAAPKAEAWDPGAIADEELSKHYRGQAWAKIKERYADGIVAELLRGPRPVARFHLPACTVRFLVPGDPRYTKCDCADPAPCPHVPLAVWSFRLLAPGVPSGLVATGTKAAAVDEELYPSLEDLLEEYTEFGVSGAPGGWLDRLARAEHRCRDADLVWPAEMLVELAAQQDRYRQQDARFDPERVADLVGELAARLDAVRADTGALPQALIRGTKSDRPMELAAARFVGLGCMARPGRRHVEFAVYLQDVGSGAVLALTKDLPDHAEPDRPQRSYADLALTHAVKGASFLAVGGGQLLINRGRRTAGFELQLVRGVAGASVTPQTFAWEELQPPLLALSLGELEARFASLPPACLRPRRVAEDFHVCAVAGVAGVRFNHATQTVEATLVDRDGKQALLSHPYTTRGRAGSEALLLRLTAPEPLRFVSGTVRRAVGGLVIHPACVVWEAEGRRAALQPWVERVTEGQAGAAAGQEESGEPGDVLAHYLGALRSALGELLLLGLARADALVARRWAELVARGEALGFARLAGRLRRLAELLAGKAHTLTWDVRGAARALLEAAVVVRVAHDVAG